MLVVGRSRRWQHMAFLPMVESLIIVLVNSSTTVASSFLNLFLSSLVQTVDG